MNHEPQFSRRERQIMDVIYAHGEASITDIQAGIPSPPSRGAMGRLLSILEEKGHVTHHVKGREYIYTPTLSSAKVGPSAMRRVVDTFFSGSIRHALAAHLTQADVDISDEDLAELEKLIHRARKREK